MPNRIQAAAFLGKAWIFRAQRFIRDPQGAKPGRLQNKKLQKGQPVIAEAKGALYGSTLAAEFALQAGKVQNLRAAAKALNGLHVPAGQTFSFWANVPRPTGSKGFVNGRELREGCIIPSVGGGLCQLSNALYQAALDAGFEIIERHEHTRQVPGSMAALGRDATVFWNYVDLRFRTDADYQMEIALDRVQLTVKFLGEKGVRKIEAAPAIAASPRALPAESCETCGITGCFRHEDIPSLPQAGITAWLVDAWAPEHDEYLHAQRKEGDWLFTPLDGMRIKRGPYRWQSDGFEKVMEARAFVVGRSLRSRKLASQGAARQKALLEMDERLARHYARKIPYTATHLVVSQSLLPFLWREGVLGGRTFDVLMSRPPMAELQSMLDSAAKRWQESRTLADFRAPAEIVEAEAEAMSEAGQWITPHSAIARMAGCRARKLEWKMPAHAAKVSPGKGRIYFPASTLGRKGAYEVRAAAKALGLEVILGGPVLEGASFWEGIGTSRFIPAEGKPLPGDIEAVVLPAWVENQPRRLLNAAAAGVPVIASENCGLSGIPGVTEIPAGDVDALGAALESVRRAHSAV